MITRRTALGMAAAGVGALFLGTRATRDSLRRDTITVGPYRIPIARIGSSDHDPLLFLHGLGREPELYGLPAFATMHHVIAPCIYGLPIGHQPPVTLQGYADLTRACIDALRLPAMPVAGHSTGATVPWLHPLQERCTAIVSADPIIPQGNTPERMALHGIAMNAYELIGTGGLRGTRLAIEDIRMTLTYTLRYGRKTFTHAEAFANDLLAFDIDALQVTPPTLILHGADDELFPPPQHERLSAGFKDLTVHTMSGPPLRHWGHEWPLFTPHHFATHTRRFLTDRQPYK